MENIKNGAACTKLFNSLAHVKRCTNDRTEYNIFQVLEVDDKEVIMCRFLYDLLNVNGAHGKGAFYLQAFLNDVLDIHVDEKEAQAFQVYKEYPIEAKDENGKPRRIDLVLFNGARFILIEVKIDAKDQDNQCYDYYQYAFDHSSHKENLQLVYLTKFGHFPSDYSRRNKDKTAVLDTEKIRKISFHKEIKKWLEKCLGSENNPVDVAIKHYIKVLDLMKISTFEEMKEMVAENILKSADTLKTSLMIADSIDKAKVELMRKLFVDLDKAMDKVLDKYKLKRKDDVVEKLKSAQENEYYLEESEAIESFYKYNYSTHPGLNYIISTVEKYNKISIDNISLPKISFCIRIEIDFNLFAGFYDNMDSKWMNWIYLPTGDDKQYQMETVPNFKEMNDAAIALADDDKREKFVEAAVKVIEEKLLKKLKV